MCATRHDFRHSLATQLPENSHNVRTVAPYVNCSAAKDGKRTMIHARILNRYPSGVRIRVD